MDTNASELSGRRVLIVEDEFLVAMEMEGILETQGCEVLASASTLPQALQSIEHNRPDLVILDRNLNGIRTGPVAEELNRVGIPFMVVTGYVHGVLDEPAMQEAPCIQKPCRREELVDQLRQLLH